MSEPGTTFAEWSAVIDEALAAREPSAVEALIERMDGWPCIIDLDEYLDEEVQKVFTEKVGSLEARESEARRDGQEELSQLLGELIGMLTAT